MEPTTTKHYLNQAKACVEWAIISTWVSLLIPTIDPDWLINESNHKFIPNPSFFLFIGTSLIRLYKLVEYIFILLGPTMRFITISPCWSCFPFSVCTYTTSQPKAHTLVEIIDVQKYLNAWIMSLLCTCINI